MLIVAATGGGSERIHAKDELTHDKHASRRELAFAARAHYVGGEAFVARVHAMHEEGGEVAARLGFRVDTTHVHLVDQARLHRLLIRRVCFVMSMLLLLG